MLEDFLGFLTPGVIPRVALGIRICIRCYPGVPLKAPAGVSLADHLWVSQVFPHRISSGVLLGIS